MKTMDIGTVGLWVILDAMTAPESVEFAQKIENLGYNTLWIPEGLGREPFAHAAHLLAHTKRLIIATGIANIWARDPITMAAAANTSRRRRVAVCCSESARVTSRSWTISGGTTTSPTAT